MSETFTIPLHTVSINNFYYADKRHGIRSEARDWQHKFFHELSSKDNALKLERLRTAFDPRLNGYVVELEIGAPRADFVTKAGGLSSRAIDLTNCEKSIIDVLFLPKHFENEAPYGCKNLNRDDKWLVGMSSRKLISADYNIKITISIVNLADYCGI
jgi:hypothetical protein